MVAQTCEDAATVTSPLVPWGSAVYSLPGIRVYFAYLTLSSLLVPVLPSMPYHGSFVGPIPGDAGGNRRSVKQKQGAIAL